MQEPAGSEERDASETAGPSSHSLLFTRSTSVWRRLAPLLRTAGRRHYPVHAQIHDHLTVMVHGMDDGETCQAEARHFHAKGTVDLVHLVLRSYRAQRLVQIGEGIVEKFDDLSLALQVVGAVVAPCFGRLLFPEHTGSEEIVGCGHVLYLLREGAHALEFTRARSKGIFVVGHGFRSGGEFVFDDDQ